MPGWQAGTGARFERAGGPRRRRSRQVRGAHLRPGTHTMQPVKSATTAAYVCAGCCTFHSTSSPPTRACRQVIVTAICTEAPAGHVQGEKVRPRGRALAGCMRTHGGSAAVPHRRTLPVLAAAGGPGEGQHGQARGAAHRGAYDAQARLLQARAHIGFQAHLGGGREGMKMEQL